MITECRRKNVKWRGKNRIGKMAGIVLTRLNEVHTMMMMMLIMMTTWLMYPVDSSMCFTADSYK